MSLARSAFVVRRQIFVAGVAADECGLEFVNASGDGGWYAVRARLGDALQAFVGFDDADRAVGLGHVEGGTVPLEFRLVGARQGEGADVGDFHWVPVAKF